jgi:hypothetical protein
MPFDVLHSLIKDGKIDFSTRTYLFIPWLLNLYHQLNEKGLGNLFKPTYQVMRKPPAVDEIPAYELEFTQHKTLFAQAMLNGTQPPPPMLLQRPGNEAYAAANRYQSEIQRVEAHYGQALNVVLTNLTGIQIAGVSYITTNFELDGRLQAIQIISHFQNHYGTNKMANCNPIKDQMSRIPIATDASGADYVISALAFWNSCLAQLLPTSAAETDSAMVSRLFALLQGQMFDLVAQQINLMDPTFLVACDMVQKTITLTRQRSQTLVRSPPAVDSMVNINQVNASSIYSANTVEIPCWNCKYNPQIAPHSREQCQALHCNNCNSVWRSIKDPKYHHFAECPIQLAKLQQRSRLTSQYQSNNVRGSDNSRGRSRSPSMQQQSTSSAGSTQHRSVRPRVAFQVRTMAAVDSTPTHSEYEQSLIDQHMDHSDRVITTTQQNDDYYSEDEDFIYHFSMLTVKSRPVAASVLLEHARRIAEVRMVLQDSGANICVTPFAILEALPHLRLHKWSSPKKVIFGNGTTAVSIFYVYLGPILDRTAVLSCVTNTILAVLPVNERGYNVTFTYLKRCIVTRHEDPTELINEPVHPTRHLYYVDIDKFVNFVESPSVVMKLEDVKASVESPVAQL